MERRRQNREIVRIAATAVSDSGMERMPLTITNLTRSGAMVEWNGGQLPSQVYVLFGHSMEPCRVVWQQGQRAGLAFA